MNSFLIQILILKLFLKLTNKKPEISGFFYVNLNKNKAINKKNTYFHKLNNTFLVCQQNIQLHQEKTII